MKINRIRFHGFGHWIDQEFLFHNGINLIEAPNESGKSTLMQGLFALLYGRNKEGNYKTKQKAVWFDRFIPWHEKQIYGGEIDYTVDQELYRLFRAFHDDEGQLVRWKTGEEITKTFPMDQKKERLFLESQIGLSGEMIRRICFIHSFSFIEQSREKTAKDDEFIYKLTALIQQGEELDIHPALQHLHKQLRQTSAQNINKDLTHVRKQLDQLKLVDTQIEQDEHCLQDWLTQVTELEQEIQTLYRQRNRLQIEKEWEYLVWRKKMWQDKITRLLRLEEKQDALACKYKQLSLPKSIRQEDLEEYYQMLQKRNHLAGQLQDMHTQCEELETQMKHFKEENYLMVQFDFSQAQQMVSLLEQYKELAQQVDLRSEQAEGCQDKYVQAEKDIKELKRLAYAPPCLKTSVRFWLWISVLSGLSSVGLFVFESMISIILGTLSLGSMSAFYFLKSRFQQQLQLEQQVILKRWDVDSVFELYREQEKIAALLKQTDHQEEQQMEQIRQHVKQWISTYQDRTSPFDPVRWKEILLGIIQRAKEKKKWLQNRESRLEYLNEEQAKIQRNLHKLTDRIDQGKVVWGTDQSLDLNQWREQFAIKQSIQAQLEAIKKEFQQTVEQKHAEAWDEKLVEIDRKIEQLTMNEQGANCLLTEAPVLELESLEPQIQVKELDCLKQKKQIASLKGSIKVRYEQLEARSDLEVKQHKLEKQQKQLNEEKVTLQLAIDTMEAARKQVEEDMAPRLKPYVSKWVKQITKERYQECNVLPDQRFTLSFFEPRSGKSIPVSALSCGTIDQMYFALRLALVQFYSEQTDGKIALPLFLDDSFVHFDDDRLLEALVVLQYFASNHQIFLCTCQTREGKMLKKAGIPFRNVQLTEQDQVKEII